MTTSLPAKYGAALTGSDWAGLPLRVGQVPESGIVEDLASDTDTILVWTGGPSEVEILYRNPAASNASTHRFMRGSGAMDLLPRGTVLVRVSWYGECSTCTSVNLPVASLAALCTDRTAGLDASRGARFGVIDAHVVDLVQRLQAQAEGKENYGVVYIQSLSLALASYVSARYGTAARTEDASSGRLPRRHQQAIAEFVERELASNFGLVDLASLTGYCPDHFARLFKQAFKQSPHQYVLSRRIERAKVLLRDGDRPLAEIAMACGFANQGHFTTTFKRLTGITPSAYRRS